MSSVSTDTAKICASLQSDDKFERKRALKDILKNVESIDSTDEKETQELWEIFHRPLVRAMQDQTESCRDLALDALKKFIINLPCSDKNIVYVIPIMTKRLSPQELIETSEEVRYKSVALLRAIIVKYDDKLTAYVDDLTSILTRTVTDSDPKVKCESSECIREIAQALPNDFYKRTEIYVKSLLNNGAHRHHKVRTITVKTIGDIMIYGDGKVIERTAGRLAERLFDQSGAVRMAVVEVIGRWLMELKDRYSWWHKLVPLLLTGMNDVVADIRSRAAKLWNDVGEQYITENDTDAKFKEKLDYLPECLEHYPPGVARPNLGCRTIVQQNLSKLIPALSRELNDWLDDLKVRAAQLLCLIVINVEEEITNYLKKLLPAMYRACNDDDTRAVENVVLASEYVAYFVPANLILDSVMPHLSGKPSKGHLKVFAGIMRGCEHDELVAELPRIARFFNESSVRFNRNDNYQLDVINCCRSLIDVCKEDCRTIADDLFVALFTVLALSSDSTTVVNNAKESLEILAKVENLNGSDQLFDKHLKTILASIQDAPENWDVSSTEFCLFQACLTRARTASWSNLELIKPIFAKTTSIDNDPKLILKQYVILAEYFRDWDRPNDNDNDALQRAFVDFASHVLEKVVVPGLEWNAGRTAEATRTASLCCLCALLNKIIGNCDDSTNNDDKPKLRKYVTIEHFGWLYDKLRPVLIKLLEDDSSKTRLYALQAICCVMNIGQELSYVAEDHIHQFNPDVLARLEDENDEVRLAAIEAIKEIWKILPKDYDLSFYYVHIEYAYTKMMTHLDDPGLKFQKQTFECLMDLMKVHPELLIEHIQKIRDKFINQKALDELIEAAKNYLTNNSRS